MTESENSLDGKDDEDKVKDDIYPPPANQTEAIRNAKEADKIRRAKIAEYFPRLNRLMGEICNHANADPEQVQTYAFSVSNSARVRKSSKWSEFEKIWISIEGKEKLIDCVIKHYKKRGESIIIKLQWVNHFICNSGIIMTDSDITKNTAYSAFLDRSEEKQLEILRRLQEYILLKNPISQRNRKNEFKKYCKTIESFVSIVRLQFI